MMRSDDFLKATEVKHEEIKQPVWLMSFADFTGCLLASFVLLFALSQSDQQKLKQASVESASVPGATQPGPAEKSMETRPNEDGKNIDYLATLLKTKLAADQNLASIHLMPEDEAVRLELPADLLAAATAPEQDRATGFLHVLAGMLSVLPNDCIVEAAKPLQETDAWGSGLELAEDVVKRLLDAGAPESLAARSAPTRGADTHISVLILRETELR